MNEIEIAKANAAIKRQQLIATARELQYQLSPATIAEGITSNIKSRSVAVVDRAKIKISNHPTAVVAAAAGAAALTGTGIYFRFFRRSFLKKSPGKG